MLFYKLFSSFKIDGAMNFLSWQVAWDGLAIFPHKKYRLLNLKSKDKKKCIFRNCPLLGI